MSAHRPIALPQGCRLVVFDLDGTLYRQGPVRRAMLWEILTAPTCSKTPYDRGNPGPMGRLRILQRFRKLREDCAGAPLARFETDLYRRLAIQVDRPEADLRAFIHDWMEQRPLRHLEKAIVPGATALFAALRSRGIATAVWSDYPVPEKLAALGLTADHMRSATDVDVAALKPKPSGLARLLEITGSAPQETLMIGDRMSRDGIAAAAIDVPFLLLGSGAAPPDTPRIADFRPLLRAVETL